MAPRSTDVLVVGGAIAGGCAALGLADAGLDVVILDRALASPPGDDYELRVSSINLASERVLRELGAWDRIAAGRVSPFDVIEVRDQDRSPVLRFEAADAGLDHCGHILENRLVAASLAAALRAHDNCTILEGNRLESLVRDGSGAVASTAGGERISARLVVGADGADSTVRRLAGIARSTYPYRQHALVCRVETGRHHGHTARQRFLPGGPLALLPLADGSCSIVWSNTPEEVKRLADLADHRLADELAAAFGDVLGAIRPAGPRATFPLQRSHAERYVDEHIALVGDACHTVHPLAGLGANQGIADAACLVDTVRRCRANRERYWSRARLGRYQRQRRPLNGAILGAMDLFHFGFANDHSGLGMLRGGVFGAVAASRPLRSFFIDRASGPFAS